MFCSVLWFSLFESRKWKPKKVCNYEYISSVITREDKELLKLQGNSGTITNSYKPELNIYSLRNRIGFLNITIVESHFSASNENKNPRQFLQETPINIFLGLYITTGCHETGLDFTMSGAPLHPWVLIPREITRIFAVTSWDVQNSELDKFDLLLYSVLFQLNSGRW